MASKFLGIACLTVLLCGCASRTSDASSNGTAKSPPAKPIVTPDLVPIGHVASVNEAAQFAVVSFPPGAIPKHGQHLAVYRNNFKVGELSVSGPERDNNTIADIIAGNVQPMDQARQE